MSLPTCGSRAASGSSRRYMSASLYTARAREILALYPPDSVTPLPPTSVKSLAGNISRSD